MVMSKIKEANLVRFMERHDVWCADVEVITEGIADTLVVEFASTKGSQFEMSHVYRKNASREIDWYDNHLHNAYEDVSKELFGAKNQQSKKWGKREEFEEEILAFGSIREELKEHFQLSRTASLFHTEDVEDQTYLH
jgi:predicted RNA-binding Zn ribbon-like protein